MVLNPAFRIKKVNSRKGAFMEVDTEKLNEALRTIREAADTIESLLLGDGSPDAGKERTDQPRDDAGGILGAGRNEIQHL